MVWYVRDVPFFCAVGYGEERGCTTPRKFREYESCMAYYSWKWYILVRFRTNLSLHTERLDTEEGRRGD